MICILNVFDQCTSHKSQFCEMRSMTRNLWLEYIFEDFEFHNTLIFEQIYDGIQKKLKIYHQRCEK